MRHVGLLKQHFIRFQVMNLCNNDVNEALHIAIKLHFFYFIFAVFLQNLLYSFWKMLPAISAAEL